MKAVFNVLEMIMKTLKITWLSCDSCDGGNQPGSFISVTTEKGCGFRLYEGDKAECPCCGATGVICADGENAWVEWDEAESWQSPTTESSTTHQNSTTTSGNSHQSINLARKSQ